uniref:Uncharacterized protein n=1 Tax=Lepisosteus oculatus TaxID=7918 RepID=W5N6T5_LEPOC
VCLLGREREMESAIRPESEGPLLSLSFQKDPEQKKKFLDSQPKALGVTQITVSLFTLSMGIVLVKEDISRPEEILCIVVTLIIMFQSPFAGGLAIAAVSLHLPTAGLPGWLWSACSMKACLVMEIISSICTGLGFFIFFAYQFILRIVVSDFNFCWRFENSTQPELRICRQFFELSMFFHNEQCLMLALNFTLGVTICSYCCKAIRCCGPASSMPVIVLNAPSAPLS